MVLTLALIPTLSPKEKENRSLVFRNVVQRRREERRRVNSQRTKAIPSPLGEGKGAGGRQTILSRL